MRALRLVGPAIMFLVLVALGTRGSRPADPYCDSHEPSNVCAGKTCGLAPWTCNIPGNSCEQGRSIPAYVNCGDCSAGFVCQSNHCVPDIDLTNVTFTGDSSNGLTSGNVSSVFCTSDSVNQLISGITFDSSKVPALAGQTQFNWHVSSGSMTLSTTDGTTIYQNTSDIVFPVVPEAAFPTPTGTLCTMSAPPSCVGPIVMKSADPSKYPGTVTATGAYVCPGTNNNVSGADMAMNGLAPTITSVYQKESSGNVEGRGPVAAIIYITGANFLPPGASCQMGAPCPDVGITWGTSGAELNSGSIYVIDANTLQTSVPSPPMWGVYPLVISNIKGKSAPYMFNISCAMSGEYCGAAPGLSSGTGCCGGTMACGGGNGVSCN